VKQIQTERRKNRRDRAEPEISPLDPRDPDIVRAKSLSRRVPRRPGADKT